MKLLGVWVGGKNTLNRCQGGLSKKVTFLLREIASYQ